MVLQATGNAAILDDAITNGGTSNSAVVESLETYAGTRGMVLQFRIKTAPGTGDLDSANRIGLFSSLAGGGISYFFSFTSTQFQIREFNTTSPNTTYSVCSAIAWAVNDIFTILMDGTSKPTFLHKGQVIPTSSSYPSPITPTGTYQFKYNYRNSALTADNIRFYLAGAGPSGPSGPEGPQSTVSGVSGPSGVSGVSGPSGPVGSAPTAKIIRVHLFHSISNATLILSGAGPGGTNPYNTSNSPFTGKLLAEKSIPYIEAINGADITGIAAATPSANTLRITGLPSTPQAILTTFSKLCLVNGATTAGTAITMTQGGASVTPSLLAPNPAFSDATINSGGAARVGRPVVLTTKGGVSLGILVTTVGSSPVTYTLLITPLDSLGFSINQGDAALALNQGISSGYVDLVYYI
jgi:hypothetical protein